MIDLLPLVRDVLADVDAPVCVRDLRRPPPPVSDPLAMVAQADPAYHVVVNVVGFPSGPWVSVVHTERFGFTPPGGIEAYTYLGPPPDGVDPDDRCQVTAWLSGELQAAVALHAPLAERARAADAGKPGPVEARDAIRRIG
jgi:hypothetical protein